ncbi:MAG: DUF3488 domain-containing protein [Bacteroidales bacterium]|nr:DUF3488 domain-containing protein [Bacteroidales bacterium]MCM1414594.1 DUF3488 domain-containing protein [bacterium]MCM1423857.1 DUF3488 domain-containing protein [bacterium]
MNRIINKRQAICGIVWILAACVLITLWPLRLIHEEVRSGSGREQLALSEPVNENKVVQQRFIAQYDRLQEVEIYLAEWTKGETFNFVLRDGSMQTLMQQIIEIGETELPGICRIQVNIDTEVGRDYYILLQGVESEFRVAYADNTGEGYNLYIGAVYYDGAEDVERCMIADYVYEVPLRKEKTLLLAAVVLLAGIFTTFFSGRYYAKYPEKNRLLTVERAVRIVCNPLIAAAGVAAVIAVWPLHLFTTDPYSIAFYEAGVLLLTAAALYAVNHDRTGIATDRTVLAVVRERWRGDLQSLMFAGAIWGCCNYMNALYEIHHTVAYRQTLIFFALALIVTYRKKEILWPVNLLYAVAAAVAGPMYYRNALAVLNDTAAIAGKAAPEELEVLALKLTVWAGVLAGFVILNTLRILWKREIHGISPLYGLLVGGFFALLILRRNTRGWPIFLVCCFTLCYLRMAAAGIKKQMLLKNIVNGVLFHFLATVGYCLLHRPYMYFRYYRYPFHFHTVTISAVYLALVFCAALIKFLDAYRKRPYLAGVYKELALFGISAMYLFFTLSRTGYLASLAMAVVAIPAAFFAGKEFNVRQKWLRLLKSLGMMALAVLVSFPVVFTAQRTIPAAAADVRLHEIEDIPSEIVHGRDMDSIYYITIERFIQVFQIKILGVPEEKSLDAFLYCGKEEGSSKYLSPYLELGPKILLASAEDMAAAVEEEESFTNGRLYIFGRYFDRLDKRGHDDMGVMEPDGNYLAHAHNIYLQVAYDHGIPVGAVFLLLGLGTFLQAVRYFRRHGTDRECALFPLAILVLFAVAGLSEWIFHPCCPIACVLLLAMGPLLVDSRS